MPQKPPDGSGAVVFFDGACAFCEDAVCFIARRDPSGYFRFGASQSPEAGARLASLGLMREGVRSLILIEGGRYYLRSTAALRIARRLTWPWRVLGVLLLVPAPIRDAGYALVAAARRRLAGPANACVARPEIRDRLIQGGT
jgi:predicted DCC family thiol-disulfide oxidoreductase YuxK